MRFPHLLIRDNPHPHPNYFFMFKFTALYWPSTNLWEGNIYRPQTKFAKVMFLQVSVCPQEGGRAWLLQGGHTWLLPGGCAWLLPGGMHGCSQGVCMVAPGGHVWLLPGGVCGKGGRAWQRGNVWQKGGMHGEGGVRGEGGCVWYAWPVIAWAVRILLECILVSQVSVILFGGGISEGEGVGMSKGSGYIRGGWVCPVGWVCMSRGWGWVTTFPHWYWHLVVTTKTRKVGKRTVRILLECCLVKNFVARDRSLKNSQISVFFRKFPANH